MLVWGNADSAAESAAKAQPASTPRIDLEWVFLMGDELYRSDVRTPCRA
jgi:hypothetical protein